MALAQRRRRNSSHILISHVTDNFKVIHRRSLCELLRCFNSRQTLIRESNFLLIFLIFRYSSSLASLRIRGSEVSPKTFPSMLPYELSYSFVPAWAAFDVQQGPITGLRGGRRQNNKQPACQEQRNLHAQFESTFEHIVKEIIARLWRREFSNPLISRWCWSTPSILALWSTQ